MSALAFRRATVADIPAMSRIRLAVRENMPLRAGLPVLREHAALSGIYSAALYRYATTGSAGPGFESGALQAAFARK